MPEIFQPYLMVEDLMDIAPEFLGSIGIRGVLMDLDNTLAPCRGRAVSMEVMAWVDRLHAVGLQGCIVSNAMEEERVRVVAEPLGLHWVYKAHKPLARGFNCGMRLLGTQPHETAMIGDMIFTDVMGGNRLGLYTILVEPVANYETGFLTRWQRRFERITGRRARKVPPGEAPMCELPRPSRRAHG